jgi:hypothetical protein
VKGRLFDVDDAERQRIWQEATTMTLYVSVVLLATLTALPAGHGQGPIGIELIAIVWGTTIGLALAHAFAFRVAMQGFGGGRLRGQDLMEIVAEVAGAAFVAAVATVPVLLFSSDVEQRVVPFVLALIMGSIGYLVERANGRTHMAALLFGVVTLFVGLFVAEVKNLFSGH